MNKIKSIFFISFLAVSSASLAGHKGLQGLKLKQRLKILNTFVSLRPI